MKAAFNNNMIAMDINMSVNVCSADSAIISKNPNSEPEMLRGVFGDKS